MNHDEIKKAWESLTPDEQTKERMLQGILERSAAMTQEESAKPKPVPWYVRLRVPMGISAAAMACAMIVTLAVDHPLLVNNGSSRQELLGTMPVSGMHTTEPDVSADTVQNHGAGTDVTDMTVPEQTTTLTVVQPAETEISADKSIEPGIFATETAITRTPVISTAATIPEKVTVSSAAVTTAPATTLTTAEETTVQTETVSTAASETVTTIVSTATALPSLYGDMYDFNHVTWSGLSYDTEYQTVSYEDLKTYLGSGVAVGDTVDGFYTILLYEIAGMPIERGFAVQYAGQNEFYLFYCVD